MPFVSSDGVLNMLYQTVSSIYSFFLAMTLHPDARNRAQAEIDAVVGRDRLPTFADREHLPYTEALVQEVFRLVSRNLLRTASKVNLGPQMAASGSDG